MLIACLVLCILFSVAGITAAEVDDKAINEDSNVISEVAAPEVDHSVATEVSEDTNDVSQNNLTASVETNDVEDDSIDSQSSDVVDTKATSNNVADNKVVGNTVVDNKDAQIVSATNLPATIAGSNVVDNKNAQIVGATNNPEIVGGCYPDWLAVVVYNTYRISFQGITFDKGIAYAHLGIEHYNDPEDQLRNIYYSIDNYNIGYWDIFTNTQTKKIAIPDIIKMTPGEHRVQIYGKFYDGKEKKWRNDWSLDKNFNITDSIINFAPNFNTQIMRYEDTLTVRPTGTGANYLTNNPSYMKYDIYVDGVQKYTGKKLNEAFTFPDNLLAGTHKIQFKVYGDFVEESWFEYYVNVNKGAVNFVIEDGYGSEDTESYTLKTTTTARKDGRHLNGMIYAYCNGTKYDFNATGTINFGKLFEGTHSFNATFVPNDSNLETVQCRFIIDVSKSSLRVISADQEYGNEIIIKINATETGDMYIKNIVTGETIKTFKYNTPLVWQDVSLGILPTGNYPYIVGFVGGYQREATFNVLKATPTSNIAIDYFNPIYLDPNFVHGKITAYNITGLLEYYVDGVKIGDGNLTGSSFSLDTLEVGNHTITVSYAGDDNYKSIEDTFQLIVSPKIISWTMDYVPTNYPEKPLIAFTTDVGYGYYTITINNKTYVRVAKGDLIIFDVDVLTAGEYNITNITYSDSHNFMLPFKPTSITIGQTTPELIIDVPEESKFGSPKEIVTTTNYDLMNLTGNITYSINSPFPYEKTVAVGEAVDLTFLPAGTYEVNVYYSGDKNYGIASQKINITVTKADVHYMFTPDVIKYTYDGKEFVLNASGLFEWDSEKGRYYYTDVVYVNDTFIFNVTMFDQSGNPVVGGTAKVYENGELIGNTTIGELFEYHAINRDERVLRFEYDGDDNHNGLSSAVAIKVYDDEIGINVDNVLYSQDAIGVLKISKPGTYIVEVADKIFEVIVNSRSDVPNVNLGILPFKENPYTVTIKAKGGSQIFSDSFYVYKNVAELTPFVNIKNMDDAKIKITSEDYNITGNLEFYLNDVLVHTMKFGEVYDIASYDFGQYNFTVKLVDDPNYRDQEISFLVEKKFLADVDVSVQDVIYGEDTIIDITSSRDGYFNLTVGNNTYRVTVYLGKASINLGCLDAGLYDLKVVLDDAIYQGNVSTSFTVLRSAANVGVEVADVIFGDNTTITFTSPIDGTYNVTVGGASHDVVIEDGVGYLTIEGLTVGNYDVVAELRNDNIIATGKGAFTVFYNSPFSIEIENYTYKQNGTITIRSAHDGVVTVTIFNATEIVANYEVNVTDGIGSFVIEDALDATYYAVGAMFEDSEGYFTFNTTEFKVDQANPNIQITATDISYGANMTVVISADLAGTYNVTFNGQKYEVTLDDETKTGNLTFEDLLPGKYNVFVEYIDNNYYGNASDDVVVNYNNVIDSIDLPSYNYEDNSTLTIITSTPGTYDVYIDGVKYNESIVVSEESTEGSVVITDVDAGDHVVFVTLISEAGAAVGANTTFKVSPIVKFVNVTIENSTYGSDAKVSVFADVDGNYTITIGDKTYSVTVVGGEGNTTITGVDVGQAIVATISIDSPNYVATNTTTFEIIPKNIDVRVVVSNITYGEDALVTVFAEVDGLYNVRFNNINGVFIVNVAGGQGSIYVSGLDVKSKVAYVDVCDSNYAGNNSTEFIVSPKEIAINMGVTDITYGEDAIVSVVADVDGEYAIVFNNIDKIFTVTVKDHLGTLHVPGLNVESNTASIKSMNKNYKGNTSAQFTVSPRATVITAPNVAKVYNVGKNYVVYLKDNTGKAVANADVTIKIGSKTYTKTTDDSGKISIAIENLKPATYKTTITFAGDKNYIASSLTTSQIVVSRATPKLTASAKTYKGSATKNYVVTFKSNTNKAIKGATLSLKVNGKTYKAKTNAKGQATFKITNLKKKGTYATTVSFNKDAYYNAVSKKVKIVVK